MKSDLNKKLSLATFITSFGDFISLFAVMQICYIETKDIYLSTFLVGVKSLGIALGAVFFPKVSQKVSLRKILYASQFISFILIGTICINSYFKFSNFKLAFVLILFETILKQFFQLARESYSKTLGNNNNQRSLQAQLLNGFFGAQAVAPVLSFLLIKYTDLWFPLLLDAFSFLFSSFVCYKIPEINIQKVQSSILKPFEYFKNNQQLLHIFLLRSVSYWIPIGIFNHLVFSVVTENFKLGVSESALTYTAIGLGSFISTHFLIKKFPHKKDIQLAVIFLIFLAFSRIAFLEVDTFAVALLIIFIGGVCNGMNAVTTQSVRRKLTTNEQFPEVVSLVVVSGRITEFIIFLIILCVSRFGISTEGGIYLSAVLLFVHAALHLPGNLKKI